MRFRLLIVFLLISSSLFAQSPMFRGGPTHTGTIDAEPIRRFQGTAWTFKTSGPIRSTPAVANGMLYFGSGDGRIYALNASTGAEIWSSDAGSPVHSSPAVSGGQVYVASRAGVLLALDARSGKEQWQFRMKADLPYLWEFDYWQSSPTVVGSTIYVGSGDGSVNAVDRSSGKQVWRAEVGARVRSTPAIAQGKVVVGDFAGYLHAFDAATGRAAWKSPSVGSSLNNSEYGFDRNAFVASPAIADGKVFIGSRDGFLYAFDLATGRELWRYDHKVSWVPTSPAVAHGVVYAGSSDGHFVQAVDAASGQERWRFRTNKPVWSSPLLVKGVLYVAEYDGTVSAVDTDSGTTLSQVRLGGVIHSSPVMAAGSLIVGCDDGTLTAFSGTNVPRMSRAEPRLAVYWDTTGVPRYFQNGVDTWVRDYFRGCGYEVLDNSGFLRFLEEQATRRTPSAVVVANNQYPPALANDTTSSSLLRRYLNGGGKMVLLNHNPIGFVRDSTGQIVDIDFYRMERVFGVRPAGKATDAIRGWYASRATAEGKRWGLPDWWMGMGGVDPKQVTTVLALDEAGGAGSWVKSYGGPEGTGLVQLWISRDTPGNLTWVKGAVEYGLR